VSRKIVPRTDGTDMGESARTLAARCGLRPRYYYRGNLVLLKHLTPRALSWAVAWLRRKGDAEHATRLEQYTQARLAA